jgi:hypothetical protein
MPILTLTTDPDAPEPEREVLFTLDGVEYTIPKVFPASMGLQFTRVSVLQGTDVAVCWALEAAIGPVGYEVLMNFTQLTADQLAKICDVVLLRIAGGMEAPKAGLRAV